MRKQLSTYSVMLNYYMGVLSSTTTDHQYHAILVGKIIPLVRRLAGNLHQKWVDEKMNHQVDRDKLEKEADKEIKNCFYTIKQRLAEAQLLDSKAMKQRICIIKTILESQLEPLTGLRCSKCDALREEHRVPVTPSYTHHTHDLVKSLCCDILNLGRHDLLIEFAKISFLKQYRNDESFILEEVPFIESFIFASSFYELCELDEVTSWFNRGKNTISTWVAWDTLVCLEWANEGSRDYLRKKNFKYENPEEAERSIYLLYLHGLRAEEKAVRDKRQNKNKVTLFCRAHIDNALSIVIKELGFSIGDHIFEHEDALPYAVELVLEDHIELQLKVEWAPGIAEFCHIHSFQERDLKSRPRDSGHILYDFIKSLYDNSGQVQVLSEDVICYGGNAKQFLKKAGINGVLFDLFIDQNITRHEASIFQKRVELNQAPKETLEDLHKCIQTLKTIRWEPPIKGYR
jgi:hypothetical protein